MTTIASGWFNIVNDALSDLGHVTVTKSSVAWVFNLGLSASALLIALYSTTYAIKYNKTIATLLIILAFSLNLVAVFDEVYDRLHFWVSVMFFASLATLLIVYVLSFRIFHSDYSS